MKATIANVAHEIRTWNSQYGEKKVIEGFFESGDKWSNITTPEKASQLKAEMEALVGKEGDFEGKDRGNSRGYQEWGLRRWPGKPQPQGGFGGKGGGNYQPRYRDTEQGTREERLSIARSVALQQALVYVVNHKEEGQKQDPALWVTTLADHFYEWLVKTQSQASTTTEQVAQKAQAATQQLKNSSPPPASDSKGPSKRPPCPSCGNVESVFQEKDKQTGDYITGSFYCWKKKDGCGHQWKDVGELAANLGLKTGAQLEKSAKEKYEDEIAKAILKKDKPRLARLGQLMQQSVQSGSLSAEEDVVLCKQLLLAEEAIDSGMQYETWLAKKTVEAQQKLWKEQDKEMQHPLDNEQCPF